MWRWAGFTFTQFSNFIRIATRYTLHPIFIRHFSWRASFAGFSITVGNKSKRACCTNSIIHKLTIAAKYQWYFPWKWTLFAHCPKTSQTFKISIFCYFLVASEDRELKTGICKSLTRKPSYSSFFSADFKPMIFEKNHWAPSEVVEVKRSFSRSLRSNFGFDLVFIGFH